MEVALSRHRETRRKLDRACPIGTVSCHAIFGDCYRSIHGIHCSIDCDTMCYIAVYDWVDLSKKGCRSSHGRHMEAESPPRLLINQPPVLVQPTKILLGICCHGHFLIYIDGSLFFRNTFGWEILGSALVLIYSWAGHTRSKNSSAVGNIWDWFPYLNIQKCWCLAYL